MSENVTLTEFLSARIGEDEAEARYSPTRTRALAECAAKRLLIRRVESLVEYVDATREDSAHTYERTLVNVLAPLALPYADHPDFREEWRA